MNKAIKTNLIRHLERKRDYLNEHQEYNKARTVNEIIRKLEDEIRD